MSEAVCRKWRGLWCQQLAAKDASRLSLARASPVGMPSPKVAATPKQKYDRKRVRLREALCRDGGRRLNHRVERWPCGQVAENSDAVGLTVEAIGYLPSSDWFTQTKAIIVCDCEKAEEKQRRGGDIGKLMTGYVLGSASPEPPDVDMSIDASYKPIREPILEAWAKLGWRQSFHQGEFVENGGLRSYGKLPGPLRGQRHQRLHRQDFKGAKPADLPIEQPTKFGLVITLKTARALGLEIHPTLRRARRRGDR